ncbi:hypothetical protein scyTo_0023216, partial [Scyliorhinus torazame]|nr:hypothetical protein [Scyliorhinus torazame]
HGKRTTVNTDDAKLLARRSKALLNFITEKCNELATSNAEQKEKRTLATGKGKKKSDARLESTGGRGTTALRSQNLENRYPSGSGKSNGRT